VRTGQADLDVSDPRRRHGDLPPGVVGEPQHRGLTVEGLSHSGLERCAVDALGQRHSQILSGVGYSDPYLHNASCSPVACR